MTVSQRDESERRARLTLLTELIAFSERPLAGSSFRALRRVPEMALEVAGLGELPLPLRRLGRPRHRSRDSGIGQSATRGLFVDKWTNRHTARFHRQLNGVLGRLIPSGVLTIETATVPAGFRRGVLWRRSDGRIQCFDVASEPSPWFGVVVLLEEFGPLIRRCHAPGCRRLFVRTKRQEYCSRSCSQRVRSATWYAKHQRVAQAARRARYQQAVTGGSPRHVGPYRRTVGPARHS
jgi:hypothetical protein